MEYAKLYYPELAHNIQEHVESIQELERSSKYFETLPEHRNSKVKTKNVRSARKHKIQKLTPEQIKSQLPDSLLPYVDWELDKKSEFHVRSLGRAEDKKRILEKKGQFFEHGAGI